MSRLPYARTAIIACSSAALVLGSVAPALAAAPTDPATPATFTRINVDTNVAGAAFSVAGHVFSSVKNDLVVTGYGTFTGSGPTSVAPAAGTVQIYRPGVDLQHWTKTVVVSESDGITFPNQPTIADVNGDGRQDIIVPGGYFFDTYQPVPQVPAKNRGSITWWENKGAGTPFVRHDVITADPFAYHGVQFADLDGDGVKDMVSTGEQGKSPADSSDDIVELRYFKGHIDGDTGERTFDAPVTLSTNGGSLPVVSDVDGDGKLDIASAQYFGTAQPSFLWLKRVGEPTDGALTAANFELHAISSAQGPAFQIKLVPNLRGDGVDRWVGTNHQPYPVPAPTGGVFELNPGSDVTAPWTPTTLAGPFSPRETYGQAAPGVFGSGDIDGDGDTDLAVSGDGDRRLFWVEQTASGAFTTHVLEDYDATTTSMPGFGQAGGAIVADLDGDGTNELGFSSFDRNTVAIWARHGGGAVKPVTVNSTLSVTGPSTVAANTTSQLTVTLDGAAGGPGRSATVTFKAARTGAVSAVGDVSFAASVTPGRYVGSIDITSKESGTYTVTYAGATASATLSDTAATATKAVATGSAILGFATTKLTVGKHTKTVKDTIAVRPGFKRAVKLQRWSCSTSTPSCTWKTVSTYNVDAKNQALLTIPVPTGTSFWRAYAPATKAGTSAVSPVRTIKRTK